MTGKLFILILLGIGTYLLTPNFDSDSENQKEIDGSKIENLSYDQLVKLYPMDSTKNLFNNVLKGGWPVLINNKSYKNTCCVRMSIVFNKLEKKFQIDKDLAIQDGNHKDFNNNSIIIKVPTMKLFLEKKLGLSTWGMSKKPGEKFNFSSIPNKKGILLYKFNLDHVNGHIDLWNGTKCHYDCPEVDVNVAAEIEFWELK
jgi:hypothetical protein